MAYNRTIWEDSPSTNTPITADRLNNMENGIQTAFDTVEQIKNADNVYQCVASYDATYNAFLTDISEFDIESVKSGDIFVLTINRDYDIPKPSLNMIMFRVNTNVLVGNIININTALEINENDVFYIMYSKESNIFIPLNLDVVLDYATKKSVERIESSLDCMVVPDTTLGYHRYDGCMYIDDSGSSFPYNYINPHTVDKEGYTSFELLLKPGKSYNFKIYIDKADMDTFTAHFNKAELHPKGSTEPESVELIKKIGKNYSDSCYVYDDYITFYCNLTNCDYYGLLYMSCKTDRLADSYAYYGVSTSGNTDDGVGIPYALSRIGKMLWHTTFELENLENKKLSRADLKEYALKTDIPSEPSDIGAEPSGTTEAHNTNADSHNDIRLLIQGLTDRLDALADCDDETLDQLSEIVAYIKNNRELIDAVTTSKVSVNDIIDNLTTNVSNKPLSAAQGVALKALIDAIVVPKKVTDLEDGSDYVTEQEVNGLVENKVDKVDGMGLSECSFTKNNENYLGSLSKSYNYTNGYDYDLGKFTQTGTITGDSYVEMDGAGNIISGQIPVDFSKIANVLEEKINDLASNGVYRNTQTLQKLEIANKEQFATASGETISINDSVDGKIRDLKLYGKSEQKQYSGKNLVQKVIYGYISSYNTVNIDDNSTSVVAYIEEGETYKVSCGVTLNRLTVGQVETPDVVNTTPITNISIESTDTFSFVAKFTGYAFIYVKTHKDTDIINSIQLEKGSTATDYEPYVGGIPSPNPNYPQEIKSVVNPKISVYNSKGTLGDTLTDEQYSYLLKHTEYLTDDYFIYKAISGENIGILYLPSMVNNTYTSSLVIKPDGTVENKAIMLSGFNINVLSCGDVTIYSYTSSKPFTKVSADDTLNISEYTETTATLPYTLNAIPVSSGGNVTIDGQQYIADYVDIERKKLVRMVWEEKLKNKVFESLSSINGYYCGYEKKSIDSAGHGKNGLCSHFKNLRDIYSSEAGITFSWGSAFMYFSNVETDILNLIKETAYVIYPLESPEETDLTDSEVQAFKELSTYYPTTNVMVTSDQLNGYAECKYPTTDVSGIASKNEAKIAEIQTAIRENINELKNDLSELCNIKKTFTNENTTYTYTASEMHLENDHIYDVFLKGNYPTTGCGCCRVFVKNNQYVLFTIATLYIEFVINSSDGTLTVTNKYNGTQDTELIVKKVV